MNALGRRRAKVNKAKRDKSASQTAYAKKNMSYVNAKPKTTKATVKKSVVKSVKAKSVASKPVVKSVPKSVSKSVSKSVPKSVSKAKASSQNRGHMTSNNIPESKKWKRGTGKYPMMVKTDAYKRSKGR